MDNEDLDDILNVDFGDVGGIEIPNLNFKGIKGLEFLNESEMEETRYTLPKIVQYDSETFVTYDNAVKLAKDLRVTENMRADAFVSGNFIFGDFIEAFLTTHNCRADVMTISTLSMSDENVDSLYNLMTHGYIGELRLIVSVYFWGYEKRNLIPYIYKQLDIDNRFQLAVCGMHTKTVHFKTQGGKHIVIHGSANLRSSGNIEQFTIEENKKLYEFFDEKLSHIIEKYATIKKPIRNKNAWDIFSKKYFND